MTPTDLRPPIPQVARSRLQWRADLFLLTAAVVWGGGFVSQRAASEHLGPATYNAARFVVAAVALLPFVWPRRHRPARVPSPGHWRGWRVLAGGIAAGTVMCVGSWFQQAGVAETTAGKAGFITGLYVLLVPLIVWLAGTRPPRATFPAAAIAIAGLYLLSEAGLWSMGRGDLLVLVSAVVWAFHVLLIGWLAHRIDGLQIAWLQMVFSALLSLPLVLLNEDVSWAALVAAALPILYNGLVCGALGFTLQIVGQRHAPPSHAAILMSLESVFAALFGFLLLGERLGPRSLLGCALMLLATLTSQWPRGAPRVGGRRDVQESRSDGRG